MKYSQAVVLGCIGAAALASARPTSARLRDPDAIRVPKPAPRHGSVGELYGGPQQRSYDEDDLLFLRDFFENDLDARAFEEYSELALRAVAKAAPKAKAPSTHATGSSTTHGQTATKHTTGSTNHALTKDHASTDKKLPGAKSTNSRTTTGAKHPSAPEKPLTHQEHATNGKTTPGAKHPATATNGRTTTGAKHPSTAEKPLSHQEHSTNGKTTNGKTTNGKTTPGSKLTNTGLRKPGEKSTTTPSKPHADHQLNGAKPSLAGERLEHQHAQHLKDANGRLQHQLHGSQQNLRKDHSTIQRLEREKNTWEHRAAVNAYRRPAPAYYAPPAPAYGGYRPYGGYGGYYRRDVADEAELLERELADELDAREFDIEDLLEMRAFDFEVDELD